MLLRLKYDVLNFDIIYNKNTSLTLNPNQLEEIVQYLYKLFKKSIINYKKKMIVIVC